jgi:3-oxoacid CoA-transferase subunit A
MDYLNRLATNDSFDLVLSHTCPYRYRPTDLFLPFIDQSAVDTTMERWMDELHDHIRFKTWLWAHYHADRVEAPHCEIMMHEVQSLEDIEARWHRYVETGELDWWLPKSPVFYQFVEK